MAIGDKNQASVATDADLLAEFKQTRSQHAFGQIVGRHQGMVARTCYRLLGNQQDAEDATQTVFLILSRHAERVDRLLVPWLHKVARDVSIQLIRSRTRRNQREQVAARPEAATVPGQNLSEEIDLALAKLPVALREAVILRYLEGRSQEEAASLLGCPRGTLSQRASRGLDKLREILARRGVAAPALLLGWLQQEATAASIAGQSSAQLAASIAAGTTTGQAATLADAVGKTLAWSKFKLASLLGTLAVSTTIIVAVATPSSRPGVLAAHTEFVTAMTYSPDGRLLASSDQKGNVYLWDMKTGKKLHSFATDYSISCLSIVAGRVAACGLLAAGMPEDPSGHVYVWHIDSGQLLLDKPVMNWTYSVALAPDGQTVAMIGVNQAVPGLIDVATGTVRYPPRPGRNVPRWGNTVAFSPDGKFLAAGGWVNKPPVVKRNGLILVYDTADWVPSELNVNGLMGDINFLCYAADGQRLAAVDNLGHLRVFDLPGGNVVHDSMNVAHRLGSPTLAFGDEQHLVAIVQVPGQTTSKLSLLDLATPAHSDLLPGHEPTSVSFNAARQELAVGMKDGTIHFLPHKSLMP